MAQNKTQPTSAAVEEFLANVPDEKRRNDGIAICALLEEITGEKPKMWGTTIVGFGEYSYLCGKSMEKMCQIGFSPRKAELVLYLLMGFESHKAALEKLGNPKIGKSCLYIKSLAKMDMAVLRQMIEADWAASCAKYG